MPDLPTLPDSVAAADTHGDIAAVTGDMRPVRRRPKPGERREQILRTLAAMLEQPGTERITTAALASRLGVSEAALYRHFASKAQMFEGLIDFIEHSVFTLINHIVEHEASGERQASAILTVLLQFSERNPGMTRVMVGDALVLEHERLTARMNLFFDRIEAQLRQCLRVPVVDGAPTASMTDAQVHAAVLCAFALGRLQRFARSGFRRSPTEQLEAALRLLAV